MQSREAHHPISGSKTVSTKPGLTALPNTNAEHISVAQQRQPRLRGKQQQQPVAPVFIDAFAGCGGLSLGLMRAGWRGLFAIEKDRFAFDTLNANFLAAGSRHNYVWPAWLEQKPWCIEELLAQHTAELCKLRGQIDLLAGGPPCQGFSSAGRRRATDPRNELVERYLQLIDLVEPKIVLLENVLGITYDFKVHKGGEEALNFASRLKRKLAKKYRVYSAVIRASRFGIPQSRPRYILVGLLKTEPAALMTGTPFQRLRKLRESFLTKKGIPRRVSARAAISDLEVGRNGKVPCSDSKGYEAVGYKHPRTSFQKAMREDSNGVPSNTRLAKHRPHITKRFRQIIALCKKKARSNIQLSKAMRMKFGLTKMATRVLDPSKPAPTITSMPDDLLHYAEPRTLTVRENARLQTFPDWFVFKGKYTSGGDRRRREVPRFTQVANAVPPLLAEMFGNVLLAYTQPKAVSNTDHLAA
jgi:DNA (cytosine-5)-methyltransferase 1